MTGDEIWVHHITPKTKLDCLMTLMETVGHVGSTLHAQTTVRYYERLDKLRVTVQ